MIEQGRGGTPDPELLKAIRRDWDFRARKDARHYINWSDVPNEENAFFESGKRDYARFVVPFLQKMKFDPHGKTVLDIGCGIGRIGRWMASDFGRYIGVDVSPEMIRMARAFGFPGTTFQAVSGGDLAGIPDESVDFVFSLGVFHHTPEKNVIFNYFGETARVLKPRGVFRFILKGLWNLVVGHAALEAGLSHRIKIGVVQAPFIRVRHLDTWQGRSIPPSEAIRECEARGLDVEHIEGKWTVRMWIGGRKAGTSFASAVIQ